MEQRKEYRVYGSLDRKLSFFGIVGAYLWICVGLVAVAAVVGAAVGKAAGTELVGFMTFIGCAGGAVIAVKSLQTGLSERDLMKRIAARRIPRFITFRHHTVRSLVSGKRKKQHFV